MDPTELTRGSWSFGLVIAGLQMLAFTMVCYFRFVVELYRQREYLVAGLFTVFLVMIGGGWTLGVLAGLPLGWRYARRWQIRGWMTLWTVTLILACGNLAVGLWIAKMPREQWRDWFGWVPPF